MKHLLAPLIALKIPYQIVRTLTSGLLITLLCVSTLARADVEKLQDIPLPKTVVSRSVALNVIQHGHRMSMATLQYSGAIEPVLDYVRSEWATGEDELPGFLEEEADGWFIISHIDDGWNHVVQLRSTRQGIEGYASVMELEPVKDWSYKPAMPRNGVLVSSMAGTEFGKPTQTDVMFSSSRQGEVAGFYRSHFEREGWAIVADNDIQGSTTLLLHRPGQQAEVVVTPVQNGSVAVVNQVGEP